MPEDLVTDAAVKAAERAIVYEAGSVEYTPVGRIVEANPEDLACAAVRAAAPHILAAEHDREAAFDSAVASELAAAGLDFRDETVASMYHRERAALWRRIAAAAAEGQSDD